MSNSFRPHTDPAGRIYDALKDEASKRSLDVNWQKNERLRVFREAREYAQEHGLTFPTLSQVRECEYAALVHTDYASKWARSVAALIGAVDTPGP